MFTLSGIFGFKTKTLDKKSVSSEKKSTLSQKSAKMGTSTMAEQAKSRKHPYMNAAYFIKSFNSAPELSDGSKLLRPICTQLGVIDIKPTKDDKKYKITITPPHFSKEQKPITQTLHENEILNNRILSRGKIKKGNTPDTYVIEYKDNQGQTKNIKASEKECLLFLQQNSLRV